MNLPTVSCSICPYKENTIFKFGGIIEDKNTNIIEKYDIHKNQWNIIDPKFEINIPNSLIKNFRYLFQKYTNSYLYIYLYFVDIFYL